MRTWVAVVAVALLVGAVPTTAILLASHDSSSVPQQHRPAWAGDHLAERGHGREGTGPPGRGSHGPGRGYGRWHRQRHDRWHEHWLQLTPEQRAKRMAALARRHAHQLQRWADCVEHTDDPASCPRPVPPGLAKKGVSPPRRQG